MPAGGTLVRRTDGWGSLFTLAPVAGYGAGFYPLPSGERIRVLRTGRCPWLGTSPNPTFALWTRFVDSSLSENYEVEAAPARSKWIVF